MCWSTHSALTANINNKCTKQDIVLQFLPAGQFDIFQGVMKEGAATVNLQLNIKVIR